MSAKWELNVGGDTWCTGSSLGSAVVDLHGSSRRRGGVLPLQTQLGKLSAPAVQGYCSGYMPAQTILQCRKGNQPLSYAWNQITTGHAQVEILLQTP